MNAIPLRTVLVGCALALAAGFAVPEVPSSTPSPSLSPLSSPLSSTATLAVPADVEDAEPMQAVCGDGRCSPPEDCNTCSRDCGSCCGDYRCAPPEDCRSCPGDCGSC